MPKAPSLLVLAVAAMLVVGCDAAADLHLTSAEPVLAPYAFFNPDSALAVSLYRTARLNEPADGASLVVEGAEVVVRSAEGIDTLLYVGGGRYEQQGFAGATSGASYTLDVSAQGFTPVQANVRVPERPTFSAESERLVTDESEARVAVTVTLEDSPTTSYYWMGVYGLYDFGEFGGLRWAAVPFSSADPALRRSIANVGGVELEEAGDPFGVAYFADEDFVDRERTFSLEAQVSLPRSNGPVPALRVVVTAMDEAFFEHHRRLELQRLSDEDPLADPVGLYSNVEGGAGVLGGYAQVARGI